MTGPLQTQLDARNADGLVEAIDRALEDILDQPDGCWDVYTLMDGLMAADLVGASRGTPTSDLAADAAAWLAGQPQIATEVRVARARRAVWRLRGSEWIIEEVFSTDPASWEAIFSEQIRCLS